MNFEKHLILKGMHAPFGASQSSWLRYDDQKIIDTLRNKQAAAMGTRLHEWAKETIDLRIKQPRSKKTIYAYINDAIGFNMSTEVILYYSTNFFGTADAISFVDNVLRIHDLKTGITSVHMEQLIIYAALFCLEYKIKPGSIDIQLRIYHRDEVIVYNPEVDEVTQVMDRIIHLNKILEKIDYLEG